MKQRCEGFIFLLTLCIILVVSLLLITSLHHILLYHKALNQQEIQHRNFYQLEHLARQLVLTSRAAMDKDCIVAKDAPNQIIQQLIHNQGCLLVIGQSKFRYMIEDLGDFPCLVVHQQQQKYASHHTRISMLMIGEDDSTTSVLQLRWIRASAFLECIGIEHSVNSGISSWRYLPTIEPFKTKNFVP